MLQGGWPRQREPVIGKHGDHGGGRMPLPYRSDAGRGCGGSAADTELAEIDGVAAAAGREVVLVEGTGSVAGNALIDCSSLREERNEAHRSARTAVRFATRSESQQDSFLAPCFQGASKGQ
jgi:hypothetical protein